MTIELELFNKDSTETELCKLYWDINNKGEFVRSVKSITEEYGISSSELLKTVNSNCDAQSTSKSCYLCELPYIYKNRKDYIANSHDTDGFMCRDCEDFESSRENDEKRHILNQIIDEYQNSCNIKSLSARQAVFLYALIRHSGNEELTGLDTFVSNNPEPFSPNTDFDNKILNELRRERLILIDPSSDLDHITLEENGSLNFYLNRVKWHIPISDSYSSLSQFTSHLHDHISSMTYVENEYSELFQLCQDLNLEECLDYLQYTLNQHQFSFKPGEKTIRILENILEKYSVSQVYNFIWAAAKNAASYYMRENIPKKQAANSAITNLEKRFEQAQANGWDIKSFRRRYDIPQSQVSRVLFNILLQTDDGGFKHKISDIL